MLKTGFRSGKFGLFQGIAPHFFSLLSRQSQPQVFRMTVPPNIRETHDADGTRIVCFERDITLVQIAGIWSRLAEWVSDTETTAMVLDFSAIGHFDTSAVVLAASVCKACREAGISCEVRTPSKTFAALLDAAEDAIDASARSSVPEKRRGPTSLGGAALNLMHEIQNALVFVGELAAALADAIRRPWRVRWRDTLTALDLNGADALPIVGLICFLMGVIMAFQAAVQLHAFGADIFVADLVGLSIARELGPLMVAVLIAGRSGAGFAAELGAMKVGEEIDALETLGLDPARFLITPKVLALIVATPLLTILGDAIGIFGGMITARAVLGIPVVPYWNETIEALGPVDILGGLAKSAVFALLIAAVGCYRGLQVRRDPQSVGRQTTAAVVTGIFFIILTDAVFSIVYNVLGV